MTGKRMAECRLMQTMILCHIANLVICELVNMTVGGLSGVSFDDENVWTANNRTITGFAIRYQDSTLYQIKIKYGETWGEPHGTYARDMVNETLLTDTFITGVDVWSTKYINGLRIITTNGYTSTLGKEHGTMTSKRNSQLQYISGKSGMLVDRITFVWYEDINDCVNIPCLNNGTCVDLDFGFRCDCIEGFTDRWCQTNIDDCNEHQCSNSRCIDGIANYSCICDRGYTGEYCETDIDECEGIVCHNGGVCSDGIGNFSCRCESGYEGEFCETDINECENIICQNEGVCVDGIGEFSCRCEKGYTGHLCENDIDECLTNPCAHGGTCIDQINAFTCNCTDLYMGDYCEIEKFPFCRRILGILPAANMNTVDLKLVLLNLKSSLAIDKKNTIAAKAKKISANDDRTSAKATGFVLGAMVLIGVSLSIVISDLTKLYRDLISTIPVNTLQKLSKKAPLNVPK